MADDFRFMKEERLKRRAQVEPERMAYAVSKIQSAGHLADKVLDDDKKLLIDGYIDFWPFTGWWSGRGIGSGRGINNLIKKLQQTNEP